MHSFSYMFLSGMFEYFWMFEWWNKSFNFVYTHFTFILNKFLLHNSIVAPPLTIIYKESTKQMLKSCVFISDFEQVVA